jgi:hypothetical protein
MTEPSALMQVAALSPELSEGPPKLTIPLPLVQRNAW